VFPYSGAILAVDVEDVREDPAVLRWVAEDGQPIEDENGNGILEEVAEHPVNGDFQETVDVVAHGFGNVFGVAFDRDGVPHTGMNGCDDPPSPDSFYRVDEAEGRNYGYPYCFNDGPVGGTGADVSKRPNPEFKSRDCGQYPAADAVLGWHVCATGLDFPHDDSRGPGGGGSDDRPFAFPEPYLDDAFIGECGTFTPDNSLQKTIEGDGEPRHTGHKVTHVAIEDGDVVGVSDFLTGLSLPTDVTFGPQGAMYVADLEGIYRVQPRPGPSV
jgi:glucose/arabinose dehydrogenase